MSQARGRVALTALLALAFASPVFAQSAENVAVVVNDGSPDSQRIGEHYARMRGLPASNIIRIRTSTEEAIEREVYVNTIERPIGAAIKRAALQDRLLYLVLTKGVPLRINGAAGLEGTLSSVDSELTLLYRRLTGQPVAAAGKIENPYFLGTREVTEARRFSHRDHDIYLVTRLDAFTVDQALALVDRAQTPRAEGRIVLDQRAAGAGPRGGDEWLERAARRLSEQGHEQRVVLETTSKPAQPVDAVLGYYSGGGADSANRVRGSGMSFVPGSIAANLASFDARTFRQPPEEWRPTDSFDKGAWFEGSGGALMGDLIREGVSGVSGQVAEAYVLGAVRPEILFPAYLAGFNLAEAFYLATPTLSWQTVIVGDPLCAPFARQTLTRDQMEDNVDATTGLPGIFSRRRLAAAKAESAGQPERVVALVVQAETLLGRDDRVGARRALEEASRLTPKTVGVLVGLAILEEQAGEYDAAIARYKRILELQPTNVIALNNLAYALGVYRQSPAEALPIARRAAGLAPRAGTVLDTLGWIEHLLGNDVEAARLLRQAISLEPRLAELQLHAAIVFVAVGQRDRAEAALKEALRLDPRLEQSEDVRRLKGQIRPEP